ncbi:MAG TPA: response regulator, partial [Polyangiaceae bacterium]|nr:response regulator [Polyangiaceae bacterium]
EGQGTGLGLSISNRIVRALGGEIVVDTELGKGTTFRVVLPRAPSRRESVVPASVHPTQSRGRILVVDDETLILRTVTRSLSRDHDVVTASNPREALARIEKGERFDVILCDVMMPEMTGIDFLETLTRDIPELAERLVFLSGGASSPALRERVERAPNLCLEKPFEPAELKRAIRDKMRAKESAPR